MGKQHDGHVRVFRALASGLLMRSVKIYPNTWVLAGNYRPELCRRILAKEY